MKKILFLFALLLVFSACSEDDTNDPNNNAPGLFSANNTDVTTSTATIEWTESIDVDDDPVTYNVYLEGQLITSGLSGYTYTLTGLEPETAYDGYIEANDGRGGTSIAEFAVLTEPEVLVFNITESVYLVESGASGPDTYEDYHNGFEIPYYDNAVEYRLEILDYRYGPNNDEPCPCIGEIDTWTNDPETHNTGRLTFVDGIQRYGIGSVRLWSNSTQETLDDLWAFINGFYGEVQVVITLSD